MSRCKSFALSILTVKPSLAVNSSIHVSKVALLPLPFLYPSRCMTIYRRQNLQEEDEDLPFADGPFMSDRGSGGDDPWAFLYQPESGRRPKTLPSYHSFTRDRLQTNSTITEREREIFTKIFESILSEGSSFIPRMKESGRSFPSNSLTQLFESAVGPLADGDEISFGPKGAINQSSATFGLVKASDNKDYPLTFRAAAARAAGLGQRLRIDQEVEAERERLKLLSFLTKDMQKCKTDRELLRWLENHVFSMVSGKDAESERKIPSASYADLLVEGMIAFRQNFNDLVGAMSVFERVKRLGAESYVVGCSTGVYNEMLQTKWEAYKDVSKIVELVDEMEVNAIEGSQKTVQILWSIIGEVRRMKDGEMGLGAQSIFTDVDMALLERLEEYAKETNDKSFEPPERDPLIRDAPEYVYS
ncbi:hypothetical protein L873DRAFT_1807484 [Choiromyces venosus 120613-1]|uniref:Mtf2-like C-terminal domain-containing protein n=1 Tax=Choiromyces venosus 120613-1 TaxID=1336337 RepID=A0A3N4JPR3_9PEZI|nr:hypothetical protein L873DRAFT_1807484 [Choiromyces venosus 120613-1]